MTAAVKETPNPRLIVVAGPNGSGKTTITDKLLRHEWMGGCVYINPDFIAQKEFGDWNSPEAVIRAANKAREIRENCLAGMTSMAFETVFSTREKLEFVQRARAKGFFTRFFFVCTNDPSINAQRVALRVMEGGHDVPIPKIIDRYYRSITNCVEATRLVDRAYFYDNSESDTDPVLMFRVTDGIVAKTYSELAPWSEEIFKFFQKGKT
uniref:Predicted ABC-type ATPase n=1 Tax=Candidatus Kentrum sp. LFY TaxID=2126342 RepID=A0A450UIU2_9GAMM|nr:MAG: Predicted ABC-type ATPase [Candidatus Kentron sp. LFY]